MRGATGTDLTYDAAGQRVAALRTDYSPGGSTAYINYYPGTYQETRENYDYDGAGRVADIRTTSGSAVLESYDALGNPIPPASLPAASASGGVTRSLFGYDLIGRQTSQTDYDAAGATVIFSRSAVYDANGFLSSDSSTTKKFEANYTTNLYTTQNTYSATSSTGEYLLGAVGSVSTYSYKNGYLNTNWASTTNAYVWWDSALQGTIAYKPNTSQSVTYNTSFGYDGQGALASVYIGDGRPRSVSYITNGDGQIVRRDEADNVYYNTTTGLGGDPHEVWYRFAGKELGYVGNNATSQLTESAAIADRQTWQDTGAFRNGAKYANSFTNFAQSTGAPINSYGQGAASGSYVVQRSGETLRSLAQQLYGDASLWYKIADANGMAGDISLSEGQRLSLPAGVARNHNNASTLTPYDANSAIGNVSPSTPKPPKSNKCGAFGQILLAAIAIAVTVVLSATPIGPVGAAVIGNLVSQGVGVATGIQEKFSFKSLAITALTAGVAQGLDKIGAFASLGIQAGASGLTGALNAAARGALTSAVSQGIGVATGLQDKFSWAGVAAAGVGAGVASGVGSALAKGSGFFSHGIGNDFVTTMASDLANAATRSAVEGSDFGDNVIAALPDALGSVIGQALGRSIAGSGKAATSQTLSRESDSKGLNLAIGKILHTIGKIFELPSKVIANTIGSLVVDRISRGPSLVYEDVGAADGVTGGGVSNAEGGTTGAGDGTPAQPVTGVTGGAQIVRGASSRERSSANDTSSSGDSVNEIVVTADSSKLKFLRSLNDGMYRIWTSELNFISKGDDYYYGNPFKMKGGVTYLTGGAGNDPNREYLTKIAGSLERAGIENVQIVGDSASGTSLLGANGGYILDAASVVLTNQAHSDSEYTRLINVKVPDGQLNFVGYSWGSIQAAQTALRFAGNGYNVDNVVLIGAPLEQSLMNKLATDPHIGRVIVINLTEFGDPIHAGMTDAQVMKAVPDLSRTVGTGTGHFSFAGTGFTANAMRDALGNILYYNGVR